MRNLISDIRYGTRVLIAKPGFALTALLTLALGIGANTAIFSLVSTVLLRPLPVSNPNEIVSVAVTGKDDSMQAFSYPAYKDFRDRNEVLSGIFATRIAPMSLSRDGVNERIWGVAATGNYFDVLGVRASIGRMFTPDEDRTKLSNPVAVLSHGCWQKRFGGDSSIVGRDIIINGHQFQVIGVAPEGFSGTDIVYSPELWVPMMMQPWIEPGSDWLDKRSTQNIFATGRLKPGVTNIQAEASLNILARQLASDYPDDESGKTIRVVPPGFIIPTIRVAFVSFSAVLMGIVALVLLLACTNLAALLLTRAAARRKEIAIRLALGASRARVIRQLLTEGLVLSVAGGVTGIGLAYWLIQGVNAFKPPIDIPLSIDLVLDWRVLAFSVTVSVVTSLLFGLVPALQSSNPELVPSLKDGSQQVGPRRSRLQSSLVVVQIALSLVLLIAAGLVVRALQQVSKASPGFVIEKGLMMSFDLSLQGYDHTRGLQFHRELLDRVRAMPGVRAASLTDLFPLSLNYSSNQIYVEGQPIARGADAPSAMVASIAPDYFRAMEIPLMAGRDIEPTDKEGSARAVIVNETFVRKLIPGAKSPQDGLGRRISSGKPEGPFWQIVGVARDGKYWTLGEAPQPFAYYSIFQSYSSNATLVVRAESDPKLMIGAIRNEAAKLDSNLPFYGTKTIQEHMGVSLFPARVAATLIGSFGLLALILAIIGIYGVISYSVSQRTQEIGIRMAIGARPFVVLKMVLHRGMLLATVGIVIGLGVAFLLTRLMTALLYGVSAADPLTFGGITLLLVIATLAACVIPARRAMKVDPMIALRCE